MENQVAAKTEVTLEAEGLELAKMWKSICVADRKRFNKFTQTEGFDTRLGKLMLALKQEAEGRIPSQRLKDCGINNIDKRRRSEALWFVENETEARAFIKASKKGFTSLSALQKAMAVSAKAEGNGDATAPKGEAKADASTPSKAKVMTASDIAVQAMELCEANGLSPQELIEALTRQLTVLSAHKAYGFDPKFTKRTYFNSKAA